MDCEAFADLLSSRGQQALQAAMAAGLQEKNLLPDLERLRKEYGSALARSAVEMALLRTRAAAKFSRAREMYFTRDALEQASGERISSHRAQRFAEHASVGDFGCGIGGDLMALAARTKATGIERDAVRAAMAAENLRVCGLSGNASVQAADVAQCDWPDVAALWCDPARRENGRRIFSVRNYQPALPTVLEWQRRVPNLGVKLSPGVQRREIAGLPAEVEFISEGGGLKEAVLWFGALRTTDSRATLLPGAHTLTAMLGASVGTGSLLRYLYQPDPAVMRAGLVQTLAVMLDARKLDEDIAYLTSDSLRQTVFARAYEVDDALPFSLKAIRARLRERGVGSVVVKKRGSPLDVDEFTKALRLSGSPEVERTVFLTHVEGRPWAAIARPINSAFNMDQTAEAHSDSQNSF